MTYGLKIKDAEGNIILTEDSRTVKPAKAWHLVEEIKDNSSGSLDFSEIPTPTDSTFYAVSQVLYWAGAFSIMTPYIKRDFVGGVQEVIRIDGSPRSTHRFKLNLNVDQVNKKINWTLYTKADGENTWRLGSTQSTLNTAYVHLFYR